MHRITWQKKVRIIIMKPSILFWYLTSTIFFSRFSSLLEWIISVNSTLVLLDSFRFYSRSSWLLNKDLLKGLATLSNGLDFSSPLSLSVSLLLLLDSLTATFSSSISASSIPFPSSSPVSPSSSTPSRFFKKAKTVFSSLSPSLTSFA